MNPVDNFTVSPEATHLFSITRAVISSLPGSCLFMPCINNRKIINYRQSFEKKTVWAVRIRSLKQNAFDCHYLNSRNFHYLSISSLLSSLIGGVLWLNYRNDKTIDESIPTLLGFASILLFVNAISTQVVAREYLKEMSKLKVQMINLI